MGIFSLDGRLARFLNRLGDLIVLNLLSLLCALPIVTLGASFSALYQVTMKMVRGEEQGIVSAFFHAFRENLKQSTLIWLLGGGISALLALDIWLLGKMDDSFVRYYQPVLCVLLVLVVMFTVFALVVQARFANTLGNTVKNGILFCLMHPVKSALMVLLMSFPFALLFLSYRALCIIVLVGASGPAFLSSFYFRSLFGSYEGEQKDEDANTVLPSQAVMENR
jgi:uncharacterized membrane protein YesL